MKSTGFVSPNSNNRPVFQHICDKCGAEINIVDKTYPDTIYKAVKKKKCDNKVIKDIRKELMTLKKGNQTYCDMNNCEPNKYMEGSEAIIDYILDYIDMHVK